jgi:hypothetical protein
MKKPPAMVAFSFSLPLAALDKSGDEGYNGYTRRVTAAVLAAPPNF